MLHLLVKRTHSLRTAGLLACLAISGAMSTRPGLLAALMLPFAAASVLFINCAAFAASLLVPDWDAMGTGYDVVLVKR